MNRILPISAILLLALTAASAQVASHAPTVFNNASTTQPIAANQPVVKVNGTVLTQADLLREEYSIFPYARQHGGMIPPEMAPQIRNGAMKMIIFEELVYQEAERRKITVPTARLKNAEAAFRKQFDTPQEFQALLDSEFHGSQQLLRKKIERSLLIESLLKSQIDSRAIVTTAEARAYYDKNPAQFQMPETFSFQSISVLPPKNATPAQLAEGRKRADEALRQAKATKTAEEFGLLAEKISDDDYRVMMGLHRPVEPDKIAPQALKVLRTMKVGQISDLIQIEQAYTILRLREHRLAGKAKFLDVKAQIVKELQQNKTNQLRAALDKKLKLNAKIEEL